MTLLTNDEKRGIAFMSMRHVAHTQLRLPSSTSDADVMIAVLERDGGPLHVTEEGVIKCSGRRPPEKWIDVLQLPEIAAKVRTRLRTRQATIALTPPGPFA